MKAKHSLFLALPAMAALACAMPIKADGLAEVVTPNFSHEIPNVPGKSLTAVVVTYRPGGGSPPHHHAGSAFIYAYVLSGTIESQVEGEPPKVYKAGASFYELPGAHHLYSRNPSKTEPASLLAVFVADTNDKPLTTPDK